VDNWKNITNSQNSVRKKSFGETFSFSNCHISNLEAMLQMAKLFCKLIVWPAIKYLLKQLNFWPLQKVEYSEFIYWVFQIKVSMAMAWV
jgi:predicted transporter